MQWIIVKYCGYSAAVEISGRITKRKIRKIMADRLGLRRFTVKFTWNYWG